MYHYAQIDENGYIVGISHLSGPVVQPDMIQIDMYFNPTNKKWNGTSWESYTPPEPPEPEPTQLDIIEAEVKKKNADIANAAIDTYTMELVKEGVL